MSLADSTEHKIYVSETQVGSMGAQAFAWRAFCSCGWCNERQRDHDEFERQVALHLAMAGVVDGS